MTMSIARLSAQSGLKYLFRTTMMDDLTATPADATTYYMKAGTPQGRWLGQGLPGINRFSDDSTEIILHAPSPSALHRQQFVLHELGHMVLRHDEIVVSSNYAESLFPNLSGEKVSRILGRSDFLDHIEAAAETLADLFAAAIRNSWAGGGVLDGHGAKCSGHVQGIGVQWS